MPYPQKFQGTFFSGTPFFIPEYTDSARNRIISKVIMRTNVALPSTETTIIVTCDGFEIYKETVIGNVTIELNDIFWAQWQGFSGNAIVFNTDAAGADTVFIDATTTTVSSIGTINYMYVGSLNNGTYQIPIAPYSEVIDVVKNIGIVSRSSSPQNIKIGTKKYTGGGNLYQFTLEGGKTAFISDIAILVTNQEDDRLEIISTDVIDYCISYTRTSS